MAVFLFTDIEGSTQKWERHRSVMGSIISRHNQILQEQVEASGGKVIKFMGDGVFAVFEAPEHGARAALSAGIEIQKRMQSEPWPEIGELRIRMAFHCGEAEKLSGDYFGPVANRTARLMALGWGGQILVSNELRQKGELPDGTTLVDLGVHQVKDIPEPQQVFGLIHPELKLSEFPALKSLSSHPNNLPTQLSPFIGRKQELATLSTLLGSPEQRLITLLGPGGMGKTRLAIQASSQNLGQFPHGAYFVDLSALTAPDQIPNKIAESIGLRFYDTEDPESQLASYLKERELLLVLDNFEHVSAGAGSVNALLLAAPQIKILVTSRERLNLSGEQVFEVLGLSYSSVDSDEEEPSFSAVRLFTSSAGRTKANFSCGPEELKWVIKICELVEGMPLGIELAATWLRLLSLPAVAERIEKDIAFLSSKKQDLPERHRSMRAVFAYSWNLLGDEEKEVLRRLSVFRDGCELEAAEFVTLGSLEVLAGLVDKSLLRVATDGRYRIHEAIRQFAAEKLHEDTADESASWDRHCDFYAEFMSQRERSLDGYSIVEGFAQIKSDFENALAAFKHAVKTRRLEAIAKSANCLGMYLVLQGLGARMTDTLEQALKIWEGEDGKATPSFESDISKRAYACLLTRRAFYWHSSRQLERGSGPILRALELFRQLPGKRDLANALLLTAIIHDGNDGESRLRRCSEARELYREVDDRNGEAWAQANLGSALCGKGQFDEGERLMRECISVFREVGNPKEEAWSHVGLAFAAGRRERRDEVEEHLRVALDIFKSIGDLNAMAIVLAVIADTAVKHAQWGAARRATSECLTLFREMGYERGVAMLRELQARIPGA